MWAHTHAISSSSYCGFLTADYTSLNVEIWGGEDYYMILFFLNGACFGTACLTCFVQIAQTRVILMGLKTDSHMTSNKGRKLLLTGSKISACLLHTGYRRADKLACARSLFLRTV